MTFPGILTPAACDRALASLRALQAKNDAVYMDTDWNGIDWGQFGLPPLPKPVTVEQQRSMCGGCELSMTPPGSLFPPGWGAEARTRRPGRRFIECPGLPLAPGAGFQTHGFIPASFPLAYDDFVLNMACHPQMLELHSKLIGADESLLRFDHSLLMNRNEARDAERDRAGWGGGGRRWHSHPYDQDGFGVTTRYTGLGLVRTLIYPEGSSIAKGGQLAVVPGYHLFRDPFKWNTSRPDDDEGMTAYLEGMKHPVTRQPLAIHHIELPPGSMVSIPAHMPHYVAPRRKGAGMRWGLLLTYRQPDPQKRFASISRSIPDEWVNRQLSSKRKNLFAEY